METKISLGALGFPAPTSTATKQQPAPKLPAREDNTYLASPEIPAEELQEWEEEIENEAQVITRQDNDGKRSGTSRTFSLPNLPKPNLSNNFDLKQGMKVGLPRHPQLAGLPVAPSMLEATGRELQADHSKEEALTKLATKTIIDVQRLEVEFSILKTDHNEVATKLQSTIDYLNAVYLQVQMLNSQNMYMAWHGRLLEYNLASLAGVQLERDLLDKARNEVQYWQQQTTQKQVEAEAAFGKLNP